MPVLTLDSVIDKLRRRKSMFERDYGVKRIGVFGSVARNEADETSDVDIVVEMTEPDLFYLVHIKDTLSEDLERPVDIVSRSTLWHICLARLRRERAGQGHRVGASYLELAGLGIGDLSYLRFSLDWLIFG